MKRPFGRGPTTLLKGDLLTMIIKHPPGENLKSESLKPDQGDIVVKSMVCCKVQFFDVEMPKLCPAQFFLGDLNLWMAWIFVVDFLETKKN